GGPDPQLDAAVRALARAPAPPASSTAASGLTAAMLAGLLARYALPASAIPTNDRLTQAADGGAFEQSEPDEAIDAGARDPIALLATVKGRGWLGRYVHRYTAPGKLAPYVSIAVDLYRTAAGARVALATNDFPATQQVVS